jgi:hypothetical protein
MHQDHQEVLVVAAVVVAVAPSQEELLRLVKVIQEHLVEMVVLQRIRVAVVEVLVLLVLGLVGVLASNFLPRSEIQYHNQLLLVVV